MAQTSPVSMLFVLLLIGTAAGVRLLGSSPRPQWCDQRSSGVVPVTPDPTKLGRLETSGLLSAAELRDQMFDRLNCKNGLRLDSAQEAWFPDGGQSLDEFLLTQRSATKGKRPTCWLDKATARPRQIQSKLGELNGTQTFVDDHLVDSSAGIQRFMAAPTERGEVLTRQRDAEMKGKNRGFGFPGSVVHNGTHFMMYYRNKYGVPGTRGDLGGAISKDGLEWTTLPLKYSFKDSQRGMEQCVLFDAEQEDPDRRFLMAYGCIESQGLQLRNLGCIATSADGIEWKDRGIKFGRWTDTQPCLHREGRSYVLQLRAEFHEDQEFKKRKRRGWRGVRQLRAGKLEFWKAVEGAGEIPWKRDVTWYYDKNGIHEPMERQIYAFTRTLHEGVYLGISLDYDWPIYTSCQLDRWKEIEEEMKDKAPGAMSYDTVLPYLTTSRDGLHYNFDWAYARQPLPLGTGRSFRYIEPAAQIVTFGGKHWLYYTGNTESHVHRFDGEDRVFLAQWEQDRLSGFRPDGDGEGRVQTRAFQWPANALVLMVNLKARGKSSCVVRVRHGESGDGRVVADSCKSATCIDMQSWIPHDLSQQMSLSFHISGGVELYGFKIQERCH